MPWDGNGNFTREHDWTDDANSAIDIEASRMDAEDDNFSVGINACYALNGENTGTQLNVDNLRMDGNTLSSTDTNGNVVIDPNGTGTFDVNSSRITSVSAGTGATDAATIGGTETLTNKTLTSPNMTSPSIGGVAMTATAAELNQLDGAVITSAQLNAVAALSANELATNDISAKSTLFDDFLNAYIPTAGRLQGASTWSIIDGSNAGPSVTIGGSEANGFIRLRVTEAGDSMATTGAQVNGLQLTFKADQNNLIYEARINTTDITNVVIFAGFTNENTAVLSMPFELGGSDALTSNASNAVGFLFDTGADTDNIWLVGVDGNVDATHQDSALAFVADTYRTLRVELTAAGAATFYIDGSQVGSEMSDAVDPTVLLSPKVCAFSHSADNKYIDVDYIYAQQDR